MGFNGKPDPRTADLFEAKPAEFKSIDRYEMNRLQASLLGEFDMD